MSRTHHLIVLGQSGLLGGSLISRSSKIAYDDLSVAIMPVMAPTHSAIDAHAVTTALRMGDQEFITRCVAEQLAGRDGAQSWVYACGVINPQSDPDQLEFVNAEAPWRLYQVLSKAASALRLPDGQLQLVTFGSVLEERRAIADANPYIHSKAKLYEYFARSSSIAANPVNWIHVRLHTLYGTRPPPPFMFLGQMEAALRSRRPFAMSAGHQLREYHHADDVADNVLNALLIGTAKRRMIALTSGRPIQLAELAIRIFDYFGMPELLRLGVVEAQAGEVFAPHVERSPDVVVDRGPIQGIITWLEEIGIKKACA